MSPLCKIAWLEQDKPELAQKTKKYIGIKEYVFHKLFGEYVVDYSIASAMGLMNLEALTWDQQALEVAGISEDKLSRLVSTKEMMKGCRDIFAEAIGIHTYKPYVIGASDS